MVPPKPPQIDRTVLGFLRSLRPYQFTKPYLKNNYVLMGFLSIFFIINFALFVTRIYQYRDAGCLIMLARACGKLLEKCHYFLLHFYYRFIIQFTGQCLNFDCTVTLVLMLRQCITFLRTRGFSSILPLDHNIYLHKMVGMTIGVLSVVHTIAHLLNFGMKFENFSKVIKIIFRVLIIYYF